MVKPTSPDTIQLAGTDCLIKPHIPLAALTSMRVGGPAEWYASPRRLDDLQGLLNWGKREGLPITMLGAGSNLLVGDQGVRGLVISTRLFRHRYFDEATGCLTAYSGDSLPRLAWLAAERGWQGLEWVVGIPGTIGGGVVMNAGAHQGCIGDILVEVQVLNGDGSIEVLKPGQLDYRYRTSNLQGSDRRVIQATLQLQPGMNPQTLIALTQNHLDNRRHSQPYHLPSCGSVFRNPQSKAAGWLIEHTGLKGYQIGGAQIAHRHANFILNCGHASATDILQLIRYAQKQVQERWSIWLEPEVKILGDFAIGL